MSRCFHLRSPIIRYTSTTSNKTNDNNYRWLSILTLPPESPPFKYQKNFQQQPDCVRQLQDRSKQNQPPQKNKDSSMHNAHVLCRLHPAEKGNKKKTKQNRDQTSRMLPPRKRTDVIIVDCRYLLFHQNHHPSDIKRKFNNSQIVWGRYKIDGNKTNRKTKNKDSSCTTGTYFASTLPKKEIRKKTKQFRATILSHFIWYHKPAIPSSTSNKRRVDDDRPVVRTLPESEDIEPPFKCQEIKQQPVRFQDWLDEIKNKQSHSFIRSRYQCFLFVQQGPPSTLLTLPPEPPFKY